jgi:hypothetical protein
VRLRTDRGQPALTLGDATRLEFISSYNCRRPELGDSLTELDSGAEHTVRRQPTWPNGAAQAPKQLRSDQHCLVSSREIAEATPLLAKAKNNSLPK